MCDKGGECPLQDFSYQFGRDESRMEFPRRTFDGEGVKADVDFGPTLMLNRNRCILCTRCVRFMREVDGDAQIGIVNRGYGSEIATFEEQGVHSLLSGNLMDVCPVGAITTRDYRFKSRPWDNPERGRHDLHALREGLQHHRLAAGQARMGKGAQLVRFTPRNNPDVNGYWMCDIGRFDYHWIEGDERLTPAADAQRRRRSTPTTWDAAVAASAAALGRRRRRRTPASRRGSCSRRTPRTRSSTSPRGSPSTCSATRRRTASPSPGPERQAAAGQRRSSRCRRSMRRTSPARALLGLDQRRPGRAGPPRRCGPTSRPAASRRCSCSIPGPAGSLGDTIWIVAARQAGTLPRSSSRACC